MKTLQIGELDKVGDNYQESIQFPSLNIRGMQSGWIDEKVRTIIPAWARAEIDIRLVLESDPLKLINLVKKHIEKNGYNAVQLASVETNKDIANIKKPQRKIFSSIKISFVSFSKQSRIFCKLIFFI